MEHLGVKPGQKVAVVRTPEGIALSAAKNKTSMEEMFSGLELLRAGRDFGYPIRTKSASMTEGARLLFPLSVETRYRG